MQQQFPARGPLGFRGAFKFQVNPRRERDLRPNFLLGLGDKAAHITPPRIAGDGLPAPRPVMQNRMGPRSQGNLRELA